MVDDSAGSTKGMSGGVQAVMAFTLVAGVLGGMWALGLFEPESENREPAACSTTDDALPSPYVSGARLCAALNRPDLPTLLGTPQEWARNAYGSGHWITMAGGARTAAPEATVQLTTYTVKVSASYDHLSVTRAVDLLGETAQTEKVLGHPAVLYSDRTIALTFAGGKASSGTGGIARRLLVARSAKDGGGSFEVVIWRQDEMLPDDGALFRVAEQVLPTIPGWSAG